jgi:hypothetical protein
MARSSGQVLPRMCRMNFAFRRHSRLVGDALFSAIDCNIDLLDTLTLSVLVAKTARDLKKSPRKLLFTPSSAVLILLLRVVAPMLTATFLTDFWLEPILLPFDLTSPLTRVLRFGAVAVRLVISISISFMASSIFPDIAKEDKSD